MLRCRIVETLRNSARAVFCPIDAYPSAHERFPSAYLISMPSVQEPPRGRQRILRHFLHIQRIKLISCTSYRAQQRRQSLRINDTSTRLFLTSALTALQVCSPQSSSTLHVPSPYFFSMHTPPPLSRRRTTRRYPHEAIPFPIVPMQPE